MQVFPSKEQFSKDIRAATLLQVLVNDTGERMDDSSLYRFFPIYRDDDGSFLHPDCVLISPHYGVVVFAVSLDKTLSDEREKKRINDIIEEIPSHVQSRLVRSRALRKTSVRLKFDITPIIYAPYIQGEDYLFSEDVVVARSSKEINQFFDDIRLDTSLPSTVYEELISTFEGAKGLIKPTDRGVAEGDSTSKKSIAAQVEAAISMFDNQQKRGMLAEINGPQRIRGLAGSGKTVVLAMKAAITLLREPDAKIVYTFYTKSLYQHVKRLITRFYRQFDDRDPDWEKRMFVIHGWGGKYDEGVYSTACKLHEIPFINYEDASRKTSGDKFDYACSSLLAQVAIRPYFDYIFIDEGQDFPSSFIRLCHAFSKGGKFVLGYDELQTIFRPTAPDQSEVFGINENNQPKATFEEDTVLHKCYRNPREILVAAHSIGFGIYGKQIVQMIESKDHWEDIGYDVLEASFIEGSNTKIHRPEENSLGIISSLQTFEEIIQIVSYESVKAEAKGVAESIIEVLKEGLNPEDILVACVDDRNSKNYLNYVEDALSEESIYCNNLHSDSFGIRDFAKVGRVTLSTVHKAKGNEAFVVYVIGCDALMHYAEVRNRNILFTAMTRAKGWLRMSGVGGACEILKNEILQVKKNFPNLIFKYPNVGKIRMMKRDLADDADRKMKRQRLIDQLQHEYSDDEINEILQLSRKGKRQKRKE